MPDPAARATLPATAPAPVTSALLRETVYGSRKRLDWVLRFVDSSDSILEVGCGTGYMLCRLLAKLGYRVQGIDLDVPSIERGRELLRAEGLDPSILSTRALAQVDERPSVIIASEVLEHLHDGELESLLAEIRRHLAPAGLLLVTVPNGHGWFELEQLLWWKLGLGALLFRAGVCHLVEKTKTRWLGPEAIEAGPPSTLAGSPHVQRFTMGSIRRHLERAGFTVLEARGSVAVAGPFSNLVLGGIAPVLDANGRLGDRLGGLAAGFFLACRA